MIIHVRNLAIQIKFILFVHSLCVPDTGMSILHMWSLPLGINLQSKFYYSHSMYEDIWAEKNKWFSKKHELCGIA